MSRTIGLEEIVMCYKPLAGQLIWAYKPSQAVIRLVMACKELPKVGTQDRINNSTSSSSTIFWILRLFLFPSHLYLEILGSALELKPKLESSYLFGVQTPARSYSKNRTVVFLSKHLSFHVFERLYFSIIILQVTILHEVAGTKWPILTSH
jgi:hypothetical protein